MSKALVTFENLLEKRLSIHRTRKKVVPHILLPLSCGKHEKFLVLRFILAIADLIKLAIFTLNMRFYPFKEIWATCCCTALTHIARSHISWNVAPPQDRKLVPVLFTLSSFKDSYHVLHALKPKFYAVNVNVTRLSHNLSCAPSSQCSSIEWGYGKCCQRQVFMKSLHVKLAVLASCQV